LIKLVSIEKSGTLVFRREDTNVRNPIISPINYEDSDFSGSSLHLMRLPARVFQQVVEIKPDADEGNLPPLHNP